MRGILEMQLIKLGELVDLPQQRRIQKLERELEELRQRQRARAEQVISSRVVADDAARQKEMNTRAYRACAAFWRRVAATAEVIGRIPTLAATPSRTSKLTRRLLNRPELRLLLVLEPEEIHRLPPGTFAAMGTSGLSAGELRAVHHSLGLAKPPGGAAAGFIAMVAEKLGTLPDFDPAADFGADFDAKVKASAAGAKASVEAARVEATAAYKSGGGSVAAAAAAMDAVAELTVDQGTDGADAQPAAANADGACVGEGGVQRSARDRALNRALADLIAPEGGGGGLLSPGPSSPPPPTSPSPPPAPQPPPLPPPSELTSLSSHSQLLAEISGGRANLRSSSTARAPAAPMPRMSASDCVSASLDETRETDSLAAEAWGTAPRTAEREWLFREEQKLELGNCLDASYHNRLDNSRSECATADAQFRRSNSKGGFSSCEKGLTSSEQGGSTMGSNASKLIEDARLLEEEKTEKARHVAARKWHVRERALAEERAARERAAAERLARGRSTRESNVRSAMASMPMALPPMTAPTQPHLHHAASTSSGYYWSN